MKNFNNRFILFLRASLGALLVLPADASDWPQLLGPTRDAVYEGPALAARWSAKGPRVLWSAVIGEGYSSPIVAEGRLVICHRIGEELIVDCLDPKNGTRFWTYKNPMKFQDGAFMDHGPRPTPAIKNGRVFIHNTDGFLACLELKDGKKIWSRQAKSEFNSSATWHGCVSSPLVTENALFLQLGGSNAAVVALSPANGDLLWQALNEKATASSLVLAVLNDKPQLLVATRSAFHSLDPKTGKGYWQYPTRKQSSGNVYAANPIVIGDQIFLSGWYNLGALLLNGKGEKPGLVWHLDDALSTHYASAVVHGGYLYGFHGHAWENGGPNLRCVELASGKVMWDQEKIGSGTIVRFADNLLILSDTGELQLAKANPKEFKIASRFQAVGRTTRSYPALADGLCFVRGPKKLVCLDLRESN